MTEGLDLKAWNRITGVLDSLTIDWPGVASELGWITTRHALWEDNARGAIAAADAVFGEKMAFNPYDFGRTKRLAEAATVGERVGLYPSGTKHAAESYFVSHEWGHLVYSWLRRHDRHRFHDLMALFASDPSAPHVSFDPSKAASISLYAKRGMTEAFADAFSLIRSDREDRWPEIVRLVSRILDSAGEFLSAADQAEPGQDKLPRQAESWTSCDSGEFASRIESAGEPKSGTVTGHTTGTDDIIRVHTT